MRVYPQEEVDPSFVQVIFHLQPLLVCPSGETYYTPHDFSYRALIGLIPVEGTYPMTSNDPTLHKPGAV